MADNHGNDIEMDDRDDNALPDVEVNDVHIDDIEMDDQDDNALPDVEVNDVHINDDMTDYKDEAKRLRGLLRLNFISAFKWKRNTCNFHFFYCIFFLMQLAKVTLLTIQMINFGNSREDFSSIVNRGDLVIRHLLLENWDASRETLPYPPAQGDFAVYTIDDLESAINYAVKNYYNAERKALGYYVRTADDKMDATMKYFDTPGFHSASIEEGLTISEITFPIDKGLTEEVTHKHETVYSYNFTREFDYLNVSQPIKRMLSTTLHFKLHSVRSHESSRKATCLQIEGSVEFNDLDNNGQVLVNLDTKSRSIKCKDMNLSLSDWQLENPEKGIGTVVYVLCGISLFLTVSNIVFWIFTLVKTCQFMKQHYRAYFGVEDRDKTNLPKREYSRLINVWDITVLCSDICTIYGTHFIVFYTVESELMLELLDSYTVTLGVGFVLAWLNMLRFFRFHRKFDLLFSTLNKAFWDVIAFLLCVGVLFSGFVICGYVVMGPYHVKFKTPTIAAETLFAVVYGDEIYATLAILQSEKSGGNSVWWFSRFYFGAYVAIFSIVVINLLIALFMSAYESYKTHNNVIPDGRELSSWEKALRRVLIQGGEGSNLRRSIYDFMNDSTPLTPEVNSLRTELSKLVHRKPRTLKVFMEDDTIRTNKCCGCLSCYITPFCCCEQNADDEPEQENVCYNTQM